MRSERDEQRYKQDKRIRTKQKRQKTTATEPKQEQEKGNKIQGKVDGRNEEGLMKRDRNWDRREVKPIRDKETERKRGKGR